MTPSFFIRRVLPFFAIFLLIAGLYYFWTVANASATQQIRVAVVPPGFSSPFHVAVKDGARIQAASLGWAVDAVAAADENDFSGQVDVVKQELQKGISAIAINPIDNKAIITAVKRANEKNIPVFMENTITPVEDSSVSVMEYIGYNQWAGADKLASYTCGLFQKNSIHNGKVYILTGIPGFHTNRRTEGYIWGLAQHCPDVTVIGQQTAEWDRMKAIEVATAALQQHPDINLFYGNSDEMGIGACIAAKKLGRTINKDIWCISIDGNPVTLDLIEQNNMTATLGVYPTFIGTLIIQQMKKVLIDNMEIPYILVTPSMVVDKENVNQYRSGSTWTQPMQGKPELDNGQPT